MVLPNLTIHPNTQNEYTANNHRSPKENEVIILKTESHTNLFQFGVGLHPYERSTKGIASLYPPQLTEFR